MKFKKGDYIYYDYDKFKDNNSRIKIIDISDGYIKFEDNPNLYSIKNIEEFYIVDIYFTRKMKIKELLKNEII